MIRLSRNHFYLILLSFLAACSAPSIPVARLKFSVSADGLYRISAQELRAAGAPVDTLDPATLQVLRGEQEIAVGVAGTRNDLAIDFRTPYRTRLG